jgi:hypothetical protein
MVFATSRVSFSFSLPKYFLVRKTLIESPHHFHMASSSNQDAGIHDLYRWNTEFSQRRYLDTEWENIPLVKQRRDLPPLPGDDDVDLFMQMDDESDPHEAETVIGFCQTAKKAPERRGDGDECVALLDDRDASGRPRATLRALTAEELRRELAKPVSEPRSRL